MKKSITILYLLCISFLSNAQIIDLTTGLNSSGSLIPFGNNEDTWTLIQKPGGTGSWTPLVSSGLNNQMTIWTQESCGRWITPQLNTQGNSGPEKITESTTEYIYQMTFNITNVSNLSANFVLNSIAGDNSLTMELNGFTYTPNSILANPSTNSPSNIYHNITLPVIPSHIICGTNVIKVKVKNGIAPTATSTSWTGFMICGSLNITTTPLNLNISGNSSFCINDPLAFVGSSNFVLSNHFWEIVECDASGNVINPSVYFNQWYSGTPGNFTFPSLSFIQCNKYYKIKLAAGNSCNQWTETNKIIYIKCKPKVTTTTPAPVCEGSTVSLTQSGTALMYFWTLPNGATVSGTSYTIASATSTETYYANGTLNGCTTSIPVIVTVAPANLDINLSTGVNNATGSMLTFGSNDDTWKVRGIPGTLYTGANSALASAKVVSPHDDTFASLDWVSSPNERWISTACDAAGAPIQVPVSTYISGNPTNNYNFEAEFTLPLSTYTNLRLELNESAADNRINFYLNGNWMYSEGSGTAAAFNSLHYPGTVTTNPAHFNSTGANTVRAEITNNGNWMGALLNIHVKGECSPRRRDRITSDSEILDQQIDATTFVFPNPSKGNFKISCDEEIISEVILRDALGRTVKELKNLNTNNAEVSLSDENKGLYFIEIHFEEELKPLFRKLIVE